MTTALDIPVGPKRVTSVAFYLPQFHPVPENDMWWGNGFTEWTNTAAARPLYPGHHQPQLPADLGFYDLRLPETRAAQAELARRYRIDGFCYYHYWFNGRRLLNTPLDRVIATGEPDFPLMLCWANENWTRVWDGGAHRVLVEQSYSAEDDISHAEWLAGVFTDRRYISVEGRPVFLVYRVNQLPDPAATVQRWRTVWDSLGVPKPLLMAVETAPHQVGDPRLIMFDAVVTFAPQWHRLRLQWRSNRASRWLSEHHVLPRALGHSFADYARTASEMQHLPESEFTRFDTVTPGWDNTPRRRSGGVILRKPRPDVYSEWVAAAATRALEDGRTPLIFVNAWNEWAEGAHLEPDRRFGHAFLEAHLRGVLKAEHERLQR